MSYFYGLSAEVSYPAGGAAVSAQVAATTPVPSASASGGVGIAAQVVAITPTPGASATVSAAGGPATAQIAAVTPTPNAAVAMAEAVLLTVQAVTPTPAPLIDIATPVNLSVRTTTPTPLAAVEMARPGSIVALATTPIPMAAAMLARPALAPAITVPPGPVSPLGSAPDMLGRLKLVLPRRWFPTTPPGAASRSPVLDAILNGPATMLAWAYAFLAYVKLQRRIKTATDTNLDLVSADFFDADLPRKPVESDASFRARILARLLLDRATRLAVSNAVQALTGQAPSIFEPARPADTGAWGSLANPNTGLAYGMAGAWGSLSLPFQAFITVTRPVGLGIAGVQGYAAAGINPPAPAIGGYGMGAIEYASLPQGVASVADADIDEAINDTKPVATVMWTRITSGALPVQLPDFNSDFGSDFA